MHELTEWLYGTMGAFYFSKRFHPLIRRTWCALNFVVVASSQLHGTVGYLTPLSTRTMSDVFYALITSNVVLFTVVVMPGLTYRFRRSINAVLRLKENAFFAATATYATNATDATDATDAADDATDATRKDAPNKIAASERKIVYVLASETLVVLAYLLVHPLFVYLATGDESLADLNYYVLPTPWMDGVRVRSQYYAVFAVHFAVIAVTAVSIITFGVYGLVFGHAFYAAFATLERFAADACARTRRRFDGVYGEMAEGDGHRQPGVRPSGNAGHDNRDGHDHRRRLDAYRRTLMADILEAIRAHQLLRKTMRIIKPLVQLLFSLILVTLVVDQCFFIFIMCSNNTKNFLKIKQIIGIVYINIVLYTYCYTGKLFDTMEKMVSQRVYDIPWYHLTPRQRKTFYIFLCQTQNQIQFVGLGVYVMKMPAFFQCLKIAFSVYNILRQILQK